MEQKLLAYNLPTETLTARMMLYRNTKITVRSLRYCCKSLTRRYMSAISVYNRRRVSDLNVDRANKRKWVYAKNGKKQMISYRNYN